MIQKDPLNMYNLQPAESGSTRHSCNLSQAPQAPLVYFFPAVVLFSTENAKGTILNMLCHALPINKYAKQNQQVHQSKQQICHNSIFIQYEEHGNQNTKNAISIKKSTPTKTPSTPSQSKESPT